MKNQQLKTAAEGLTRRHAETRRERGGRGRGEEPMAQNSIKEPVLVIMAAGMGSRYGGLKQMDPMTDKGEIILDFSLYDAVMAGFKKVIFVIKESIEEDFRKIIDGNASKYIDVEYAFQRLDDIPAPFKVPEGREKPWGTCHAVMACRDMIDGPFVAINADDYYGPGAFASVYDFLTDPARKDNEFCMAGYLVENTLSESGHVARGVCETTADGYLDKIVERLKIMHRPDGIAFTEDDGETWTKVAPGTTVSMNFWGFSRLMMDEMIANFPEFLDKAISENPMKGEYLLPLAVERVLKEGKATVKVLPSRDKWYGVTYKEDKESVMAALQSMKDKGLYPDKLWK